MSTLSYVAVAQGTISDGASYHTTDSGLPEPVDLFRGLPRPARGQHSLDTLGLRARHPEKAGGLSKTGNGWRLRPIFNSPCKTSPHFQQQTGKFVKVIYGSSGSLFQQTQNGAPFDMFFSANLNYPNKWKRMD